MHTWESDRNPSLTKRQSSTPNERADTQTYSAASDGVIAGSVSWCDGLTDPYGLLPVSAAPSCGREFGRLHPATEDVAPRQTDLAAAQSRRASPQRCCGHVLDQISVSCRLCTRPAPGIILSPSRDKGPRRRVVRESSKTSFHFNRQNTFLLFT